jgi:hypothetical protein
VRTPELTSVFCRDIANRDRTLRLGPMPSERGVSFLTPGGELVRFDMPQAHALHVALGRAIEGGTDTSVSGEGR